LAAEAEEESDVEETHPGTPGSAVNDSTVVEWKNSKRYSFDIRDLGQFMRINVKPSVKQVAKTSQKPNKCDPSEWDALPWDGVKKIRRRTNPSVYITPVESFVCPRK
jgi:hypothetical protein